MRKHISVFLENIIMFSKKFYSVYPNDVPMKTYFCFLSVEGTFFLRKTYLCFPRNKFKGKHFSVFLVNRNMFSIKEFCQ
jgi:hypothetical protein